MFLNPSDFIGKYQIAQDNYSKENLELYIDKYEKLYLQNLLGCEMYDLFVADLNSDEPPVPQQARFLYIYNEFCIDDSKCNEFYVSEGILEMLKGFIYYEYVKDQKYKNTIVGTVVNETAFSREVAQFRSNLEARYNLAIDTYQSIQKHIFRNAIDYPEYNGVSKRAIYFNGGF